MIDPEVGFRLHPRLAADTLFIKDLSLSRMLLMNDARFPWVILVPRRADIREWYELEENDQALLLRESLELSRFMQLEFKAEKMNLGALGNMVPQLHLHHVARSQGDDAWPDPVWGQGVAVPYPAKDNRIADTLLGFDG